MSAYAPSAVVAQAQVPHNHLQMRPIGKWVEPDGWTGRWCWDRYTTAYPRGGKIHELPNLYWIADFHVYQRRLNAEVEAERWKDAKDLPEHLREAMLDFHGADLTPAMRLVFADQIAARAAKAAATRRPAPAPRAAPKKTAARRSKR